MEPSSGGNFGIKLVADYQFKFNFFNRAGKPTLMNFPDSEAGRRFARVIPNGNRSLVYLMSPTKRFGAAIKYIKHGPGPDDLQAGIKAAVDQGAVEMIKAINDHYARHWRCVEIVAWMDNPQNAPTPDFGFQQGADSFDISRKDYLDLFDAIDWDWTKPGDRSAI